MGMAREGGQAGIRGGVGRRRYGGWQGSMGCWVRKVGAGCRNAACQWGKVRLLPGQVGSQCAGGRRQKQCH